MPMAAKGLSKLIEECAELLQVAGKKLAYYTTDTHPDCGPPLLVRMQEEMGDVLGAIEFVIEKWGLDWAAILERKSTKLRTYRKWDADPTNNAQAVDGSVQGSQEPVRRRHLCLASAPNPSLPSSDERVAYVVEKLVRKDCWLPVYVDSTANAAEEAMTGLKGSDRVSSYRVTPYLPRPPEEVRNLQEAAPEMWQALDSLEDVLDEQIFSEQVKEDFDAPDSREYSVKITAGMFRVLGRALQKARHP